MKKIDRYAAWNPICYSQIENLPEGAKFEYQHINQSRNKLVLTECDDGDWTVISKQAQKFRSEKQSSDLSLLAA